MVIEFPERHLTEQEFFSFAKLHYLILNKIKYGTDKEDNFLSLSDFSLANEDIYKVFSRLYMSIQILELEFNIRKNYHFNESVSEAEKEIKNRPPEEHNNLEKLITKIKTGKKIKIRDVGDVSWVWYEIYSSIRFLDAKDYKIPEKIKEIYEIEMNKYLDNLISNNLEIDKVNYFRFETLKKMFVDIIIKDKKIELYGNNFIITEGITRNGENKTNQDFCILQTTFAMQKLGYLKVNNFWETIKTKDGLELEEKDKQRFININITIKDNLLEEINNNYKKDNPKNTIEKESFDSKNLTLTFSGEKIEISKSKKETDPVLLIKTLIERIEDDWIYSDEILENWGYNSMELNTLPKNKVYHSAQKLNNIIATKTKITDFIEITTSKVRINPKYKKVYE